MLRGYGCRRVTRLAGPYAEPLMRRVASVICCVGLLAGCAVDPEVSATDAEHSDATFDPADDPFGWTPFGDTGRSRSVRSPRPSTTTIRRRARSISTSPAIWR